MFVGLLKCPKAIVEVAWDPRLPWPRFSRKLTFQHSILDSIGLSPGLVRWSRFVAKTLYPIEVEREKLTQFCCRRADLSRACFGLVNLSIRSRQWHNFL